MAFAGVTGLPMDTPLRRKLFDDVGLEKMLYQRSGLLGLSDISGDMRVLQENKDPAQLRRSYAMIKYT